MILIAARERNMCPTIVVETGVDISDIGRSFNQELTNAIKIGVTPDQEQELNPKSCHFLQFITRQTPELFSYKQEGKVIWETADTHYMQKPFEPKWRVDSVGENPFYESGGVNIFTAKECAVFDQPSYSIEQDIQPERIIGCTFVIVDEKVIGKVLWSRQNVLFKEQYYDAYQYDIDTDVNQLPDWALLTMQDAYTTNKHGRTKAYQIPEFLQHDITKSPGDAILEASQDLKQHLPPDDSWALLQHEDFKQLMQPPSKTQQYREEMEELRGMCGHPHSERKDWDNQTVIDSKDDKAGPGYGF